MIDFNLVEKSTDHSLSRLQARTHTDCDSLFFLSDFLHPELLNKLRTFVEQYPDELWDKEINQESKNRLKINWVPESVIEETHMVMQNLTDQVNKIFNKSDTFVGITVWKDREGYRISKHVDIPFIDLSMQIYLNHIDDKDYATEFEHNGSKFQANYMQNSGYLLGGPVTHSMTKQVGRGHTRYSLYAIWRQ